MSARGWWRSWPRPIPPALAPLLMNAVTILVTAGVAAFIASDRLRTAVPDRRIRLALAIGFVLMPAAQDLSWHLVYLQWSLAFFLLARVLADAPGPRWVWPDRAAVAIAGLTGPFSILFAPLYLWRRRQLGAVTWIVVGCAARPARGPVHLPPLADGGHDDLSTRSPSSPRGSSSSRCSATRRPGC